jgi:hypothetical protein
MVLELWSAKIGTLGLFHVCEFQKETRFEPALKKRPRFVQAGWREVIQTRKWRPLKSGGWALNLLIVQAGPGLNPF